MNKLIRIGLCIALVGLFVASPRVAAQRNGFEQPPIDYLNAPVNDPVAQLAAKIEKGETKLAFDDHFGYLQSVLKALDVPVSSQMLVFSKTSLQLHRISPRLPRALYFNDDVYVGFCQRGDVLEFATTDPKQGATFYTLKQSDKGPPKFVRDRGGCLTCHASTRTQNVPGYLVRSVFADGAGRPKLGSGTFTTDHTSDFHDRWGGWYVTGKHGAMRHMGNQVCLEDEHTFDRDKGANKMDLSNHFRPQSYLSPHSDIVALMVLEHQTQMHNAIAAANYETRQALHQSYQMNELLDREPDHISESAQRRIASAAENVLEYLLMCDEFRLTDSVHGSSDFASEFRLRGKMDSKGRSLRELDLRTRLFRYPCSYLIHSPAFEALPDEVREPILTGLVSILTGENNSEKFNHLSPELRDDIRSILRATNPEYRKYDQAARAAKAS
jgi:hypothetical protein